MVHMLVGLQAQWATRTDELLGLGAPDWRPAPLTRLLRDLVERSAPEVDRDTAARLRSLVVGLPARFEAIASCGLPDTLVHGDFHPGNVRGAPGSFVLLDWGDCGVGHPMLDQAALFERLPPEDQQPVCAAWAAAWQEHIDGCDPVRASELLAPVAALRQALIYQVFLDGIEPDERIYHADDPALWLARAAELADIER
jgi:aminoglycoside phosphotransferase (APT) family kinase protein